MTKKPHTRHAASVPIHPIVTEGPLPRDPLNVRIVKRELHRLEQRIIEENGEITELRRLLVGASTEELWEVPG